MAEELIFPDRTAFRTWLAKHTEHPGVWLIFSKDKVLRTVSAAHALEEALCFGWIDGQMERLDDSRYRKYFSPRRPQSRWSEKNRRLAEKLEASGLMTPAGRAAMDAARKAGTWDSPARTLITPEQVDALKELLRLYPAALANLEAMSPSVQRTYTGAYFSTKTEAGRVKKLSQLVERLELNLDPMASLAKKKAELGL